MEWDRMKSSGVERNEVVIPLFGYFNFNDRMEGGKPVSSQCLKIGGKEKNGVLDGIGWNPFHHIISYFKQSKQQNLL